MWRHLYYLMDASLSRHLVCYLFIVDSVVVDLDQLKWLTIFYSDGSCSVILVSFRSQIIERPEQLNLLSYFLKNELVSLIALTVRIRKIIK